MYNIYPHQIDKNTGLRPKGAQSQYVAESGYEALGVDSDHCVIYSKPLNKIVRLGPKQINDLMTLSMNLGVSYLDQFSNTGSSIDMNKHELNIVGLKIMDECHNKGAFDDVQIRGRGFWAGEDGTILVNSVNLTDLDGNPYPRRNGNYIYEAAGGNDYFHDTFAADENVGRAIVDLFETFSFANASESALRMVGYLGTAYMPGILPWRPSVMMQGESGLGKSSLGKTINLLLGPKRSNRFTASDTTVAGVVSSIGSHAIPLILDEWEASERTSKILSYNRSASEGIVGVKGSSSGKSVSKSGRTSFLFGGINPPKMEDADANRLVVVKMQARKEKRNDRHFLFADDFHLDTKEELVRLGNGLCARMLRRADELISTAYRIKDMLVKDGFKDRIADTFAPIVAAAWIMLNDAKLEDAQMSEFVAKFNIEKTNESTSLAQGMFATLMNAIITNGTDKTTLNYVIRKYVVSIIEENKKSTDYLENLMSIYGIRAVFDLDKVNRAASELYLLVKNTSNDNLLRLAPEESRKSLDFDGVLMQQPGATRSKNAVRFSGIQSRAVRIPLQIETYLSKEELEADTGGYATEKVTYDLKLTK